MNEALCVCDGVSECGMLYAYLCSVGLGWRGYETV